MKTSAELIWYQSEKRFHPRANKHRAPETASRSAIFISPPGACSSELLLTFKRLSDWRSWTPGHAVSNGLILCLHRGDISGLHMSVTEPPPHPLTGAVSSATEAEPPLRKSIWSSWNSLALLSVRLSSSLIIEFFTQQQMSLCTFTFGRDELIYSVEDNYPPQKYFIYRKSRRTHIRGRKSKRWNGQHWEERDRVLKE